MTAATDILVEKLRLPEEALARKQKQREEKARRAASRMP
jgi:hypothetical protein